MSRPRPAESRRPRLLLHGPVAPVLRHWREPAVARQERREVRPLQDPQSAERRVLVRQEAWALLLAHNMIAGLAARAAATAGLTPGEITFTAVLSLARAAITADTCCPHCHKRPASGNAPFAGLGAAITALPPGRAGRQRTSGRTPAERRKWISEPADYTLTIVPSNLPKTDVSLRS